jgi:transposase
MHVCPCSVVLACQVCVLCVASPRVCGVWCVFGEGWWWRGGVVARRGFPAFDVHAPLARADSQTAKQPAPNICSKLVRWKIYNGMSYGGFQYMTNRFEKGDLEEM